MPFAFSVIRSSDVSADDLHVAFGRQPGEEVLHFLQPLWRMALPFFDLADDPQGMPRAIGFGRVAWKLLVGEVGILEKLTGRLDDIDPLAPLSLGQLATPD